MPSNQPFGFRVCRHLSGGDPNRNLEFPIASGYATNIGTGDPVKLLADGSIASAAAGDRILGIFMGVQYIDSLGNAVFAPRWPASAVATEIKASVIVDPLVTFEVQSAGTPAVTDIGTLADHVAGTPSTIHGGSTAALSGTMATGAAGFRVIGIINKPGNTGQYASVEVVLFETEFSHFVAATPGV
jgi:hypothetical protein